MTNFHLWEHIWEFFYSLEDFETLIVTEILGLVEDTLLNFEGVGENSILPIRDLISLGYSGPDHT